LAKLAVEVEQALARRAIGGHPSGVKGHLLAAGDGWTVQDVVCTAGPNDQPFEEQHSRNCIAIVMAGSFQYRSGTGNALMTPGSLLLGSAGEFFECGHEHGAGDRCVSFHFAPEYFERIAADVGVRGMTSGFRSLRVPPLRALAPITAQASAGLAKAVACHPHDVATFSGDAAARWEELGVQLAAQTVRLVAGLSVDSSAVPSGALRGVTRVVRMVEREPAAGWALQRLAGAADLSPYHFLRTFERVTGVTPHQYLLRLRLREAASRLARDRDKVIDVSLECGFGDVSNFNRAFRAEFGVSPRVYRLRHA
jgi:AraC family transcriptional regulator